MIDAFVTYIQAEKRYSALTVRNYRHDIETFATWCSERAGLTLGQFNPANVTKEDISDWIIHRMENGKISPASMNRELSSLRSFYKYLRCNGFVSNDLFATISALKTSRKLPTFVPESRMEGLLDTIRAKSEGDDFHQQRNALIVTLFYSCGIRLAELLGIRIRDFSADLATLHIRGKGDKHRIIPILSEVASRVESYLELLNSMGIATTADAPLIVSEEGSALSRSSIQRIVKSELGDAEVQGKKSPHVLRHTFATHLLNKDADMRNIQELMGHASLRTTQCYTHNSIAQLREVYKRAHPHK